MINDEACDVAILWQDNLMFCLWRHTAWANLPPTHSRPFLKKGSNFTRELVRLTRLSLDLLSVLISSWKTVCCTTFNIALSAFSSSSVDISDSFSGCVFICPVFCRVFIADKRLLRYRKTQAIDFFKRYQSENFWKCTDILSVQFLYASWLIKLRCVLAGCQRILATREKNRKVIKSLSIFWLDGGPRQGFWFVGTQDTILVSTPFLQESTCFLIPLVKRQVMRLSKARINVQYSTGSPSKVGTRGCGSFTLFWFTASNSTIRLCWACNAVCWRWSAIASWWKLSGILLTTGSLFPRWLLSWGRRALAMSGVFTIIPKT